MSKALLEVKNMKTSFYTHLGEVQAVRGIEYHLNKGETLGIVGESGSGKSVSSMSIMGLLQHPGKVKEGEILFHGENILDYNERKMRDLRGNRIAMIFQDPMTSLNPLYTVGSQIVEVLLEHKTVPKSQVKAKAIEMLELVGIPDPESRFNQYPHEFSGGMRQRVIIAIALACEPELLIADEPTTALDVTIQAQILDLMNELKEKVHTSIILITHDLGVVANSCSRVVVMYGGLIMEEGLVNDIFYDPKHPYTQGLLKSVPNLDIKERLIPIEGTPPDLLHPPKGCPFAARCPHTMRVCLEEQPKYYSSGEGHRAMCWLLDPEAPSSTKEEA